MLSNWDRCAVQLTRRYLLLTSCDGQRVIAKITIPDILTVIRQPATGDHPYTVRLQVDFAERSVNGVVLFLPVLAERER